MIDYSRLKSLKLDASLTVPLTVASPAAAWRKFCTSVCPTARPEDSAGGLVLGVLRCRGTGIGDVTRDGDCTLKFERVVEWDWESD